MYKTHDDICLSKDINNKINMTIVIYINNYLLLTIVYEY